MSVTFPAATRLERGFVRLRGPDAAGFLQRMVSNDVLALAAGESCEALLLTPKARVIAVLRVLRQGEDDFLLVTEPQLAETVQRQLLRARFAAKVDIQQERHDAWLVLADEPPAGAVALPTSDYGVPGYELLDAPPPDAAPAGDDELELLRIQAGTPRFGREIDDRILPAEAGLVERAVSLTKGCYPGQEPIARLHYRGHANRGLRVLEIEGDDPPEYDAPLELDGKNVGRMTSAVRRPEGGVVALGYVRREVPEDAELRVEGRTSRSLHVAAARR